jgi:hypothetical protein
MGGVRGGFVCGKFCARDIPDYSISPIPNIEATRLVIVFPIAFEEWLLPSEK